MTDEWVWISFWGYGNVLELDWCPHTIVNELNAMTVNFMLCVFGLNTFKET